MHLLTIRKRRAHAAREPQSLTPRDAAVRLLAEKIAAGKAGLDPYDKSIFILKAGPNERVWCYRVLELTGTVLSRAPRFGGGERFRALLEADVRNKLGLDRIYPPLMLDEPLASRAVDAPAFVALGPARPTLVVVDGPAAEPEAMVALRQAKDAFERSVH